MRVLTLFAPIFKKDIAIETMSDHTLYQITTRTNTFYGQIMYQDDVMMKLQTKEGKPVKILKENITDIKIL